MVRAASTASLTCMVHAIADIVIVATAVIVDVSVEVVITIVVGICRLAW